MIKIDDLNKIQTQLSESYALVNQYITDFTYQDYADTYYRIDENGQAQEDYEFLAALYMLQSDLYRLSVACDIAMNKLQEVLDVIEHND